MVGRVTNGKTDILYLDIAYVDEVGIDFLLKGKRKFSDLHQNYKNHDKRQINTYYQLIY